MFERPRSGELAILVHLNFPGRDFQEDIEEFRLLANSAGAEVVAIITGSRDVPEAKFFVGTGKAAEIQECIKATGAELVLFNHALTPAQERNLERLLQCRVLDRTSLILDIFAQRARTFEGKLQVELAQLQHMSTRLVRGWTHLERQKGGIGLRGPGETQLETDRRLIRERIKSIEKRLQKVKQQRQQGRRSRTKALLPTVSVVGYTNAGKSTLFNRLTGSEVYVANQLFATLDPTLRKLSLPNAPDVILADTVGFIRHLPHDLVEAFQATLEETRDASLLLQVVDIHDPQRHAHTEQVNAVLEMIGAEKTPQLQVYNKIDLLEECQAEIMRDAEGRPTQVWVSAATGAGLDLLLQAVAELVYGDPVYRTHVFAPTQGKLRAMLYEKDAVLNEHIDEEGNWVISLCMAKRDYAVLCHLLDAQEEEKKANYGEII